jgi:peptidoglycan/LPS O-acetylase OafA/YrhL
LCLASGSAIPLVCASRFRLSSLQLSIKEPMHIKDGALRPEVGPTTNRTSAIRTDVEALRAVAILLVVAFHGGIRGITGGFVGVDVFYVLSGYLITGQLVGEIHRTHRLSLLQFYARRVRRLLPAASLVLLATLLAACVLFAPEELTFTARGARASALYMSNMFFATNAADYFAPRVASNPLLHTWSLSVEEQFYFFWPLLILLGLRTGGNVRALLILMITLTTLSLATSVWFTAGHPVLAFYALPFRAWEFGLGGLAALLPRGALMLPDRVWLSVGWLGMAMVLGSALAISTTTSFPGYAALVPVLGTTFTLVASAEKPHSGVGKLLDLPLLQKLGGLSYSWYLWHWPFLVFLAALVPVVSTVDRIAALLASLAVAMLTHRFFENPIRFNPHLAKRPIVSLSAAAAIGGVCLVAATLSLRFAEQLGQMPGMQASAAAVHDIASIAHTRCISLDGSSSVKTCEFGASTATTTVVLFGDSHAIPWFEPLHRIAEHHGWKLITVLKSGCSAAAFSADPDPVLSTQCSQWREQAIHDIVASRPSLVFLGSATNRLKRHIESTRHATPTELEAIQEGTRRTVQALTGAGLHVMFARDNPEFSFDMPTCLAHLQRHAWYASSACEMPLATVLDPAIHEAEQSAIRGLPNVHYIDLTNRFCHASLCGGVSDGMVIYRDTDHLTGHFAASLAAVLEPQVLAALRNPDAVADSDPMPSVRYTAVALTACGTVCR